MTATTIRVQHTDAPSALKTLSTPVDHLDRLSLGLTSDFAKVVEQTADVAVHQYLPTGLIVFDLAAHGAVGSSSLVFSRLAVGILALLSRNAEFASDQELIDLLNALLVKPV